MSETLRSTLIGLCAGKESFTPGEARALAIAAAKLALEDAAGQCKDLMKLHEALGGLTYYIGASQCESRIANLAATLDAKPGDAA